MKGKIAGSFVLAVLAGVAAPALAHHSFSAEFDIKQPIKLTGTVSGMKWANPHAWIYIDVKDASGKVVTWAFETTAANTLYRRGWRKEDVVPGIAVTVDGWAARDGTPKANTGSILLPDGRRLLAGSPVAEGGAR